MPQTQATRKEEQGTTTPNQKTPTEPLALPSLSSKLRLPAATSPPETELQIPADIIKTASRFGIAVKDIKLIEGTYVGCSGENCFPLGKAEKPAQAEKPVDPYSSVKSGSTLKFTGPGSSSPYTLSSDLVSTTLPGIVAISRNKDGSFALKPDPSYKGTIEIVAAIESPYTMRIDSAAIQQFQKVNPGKSVDEARQILVKQFMDANKHEPLLVVGTVPSLCPPCKLLEPCLTETGQKLGKDEGKLLIVEYPDFESAKADFGSEARFPTLMFLRATTSAAPPIGAERPLLQGFRRVIGSAIEGVRKPGEIIDGLRSLRN